MKQNVFILAAAAMLAASCSVSINGNGGSQPPAGSAKAAVHAAESAAAKGFTGIRINGGYDVYYTPGAQTSIRLEGDADCIRRTIVENKGNTLIISPAKGKGFFKSNDQDVDIYITSPAISNVSVKGSGDFTAKGDISTRKFSAAIAGSGDVRMRGVTADAVSVSVSGSGDVEIGAAKAGVAEFSISGSGDIGVKDIKAGSVKARIAGSGDVEMARADIGKASCSIAGSGDISIKGSVDRLEKSVAGSGTVSVSR